MWKLIIKNLWNRRRQNGWLLGEMVLVSIVTWIIADPVVVLIHDKSLSLGYDADRLCILKVETLAELSPQFDKQATDPAVVIENFNRILQKVREQKEVDKVTPLLSHTFLNSRGSSSTVYQVDTLEQRVNIMYYPMNQSYFETYGIRTTPESPTAEELSRKPLGPNEMIVTQDLVDHFFKDGRGVGKQLFNFYRDSTFYCIVGVVENLKVNSAWRPSPIAFVMDGELSSSGISNNGRILVRLKEGVSMEKFVNDFKPWMIKNLSVGNLFIRSIQPYNEILSDSEYASGVTNKIRLNIALAVFFMFSLCLGVIGTFWLQTRKRREEIGILLSFGAHPSYIIRMLLGEGWVLSTLAFILGCLIYLQYAIKEGLYVGDCKMAADEGYWVSSFGSHFIGVSVVVYLIILVVVSIGIYIPAYKISKINPVDALRDE